MQKKKLHSTNFTVDNRNFCLSLHYNGGNNNLFVNGKEIINFKAKDSEIVPYPLLLGGLLKDFRVGYMTATELTGYASMRQRCGQKCFVGSYLLVAGDDAC